MAVNIYQKNRFGATTFTLIQIALVIVMCVVIVVSAQSQRAQNPRLRNNGIAGMDKYISKLIREKNQLLLDCLGEYFDDYI